MICNQTTFLPHIFIFIFFYPALFICRVCEWLLDDLWTGTLSRMGGASKWLTQKDCGKTKGWRRVFCLGIRWRKPVCRDARSHLYFPRVKSDMQRKTVVTVWPAKCSTLLTKTREREREQYLQKHFTLSSHWSYCWMFCSFHISVPPAPMPAGRWVRFSVA